MTQGTEFVRPSLLLKALRFYITWSPLRKGKGRLEDRFRRELPRGRLIAGTRYGFRLGIDLPADRGWECVYFRGTYETGTSRLCRRLLRPGDVTFDLGANIGWYTLLFAGSTGPSGRVHAFEPVPATIDSLVANCALNGFLDRTSANRVAIGRSSEEVTLYTPVTKPHGETSASAELAGPGCLESRAPKIRLDEYWNEKGRPRVALVKIDIEGLEEEAVAGAEEIMLSESPPMWLFEVNFESAGSFGWSPRGLLDGLQKRFGFAMVRIPGAWGEPREVQGASSLEHGDNALLYLPASHGDRLIRR
jgi:FkbM family methyltransferase